ncbi:MAG TPA: hypothetical protein DEF45_05255 [Rhodopirellula sp.]|nr:hypothetical protein [Rhodopirellula sp.]
MPDIGNDGCKALNARVVTGVTLNGVERRGQELAKLFQTHFVILSKLNEPIRGRERSTGCRNFPRFQIP